MTDAVPQQWRVGLPTGVTLAVRVFGVDGAPPAPMADAPDEPLPGRAFLLVHGLASNALLWDGVAERLVAAGHRAYAVDLRGHGESDEPPGGYDTETCANDLAELCRLLALTGADAPIAVGQSWGASVVLELAAKHDIVAALALVDGGWGKLRSMFPNFDECWAALAPPRFDGVSMESLKRMAMAWHPRWSEQARRSVLGNFRAGPDGVVVARLSREHHRSILRSMWWSDPARLYPKVSVPTLLAPAVQLEDDRKRVLIARAEIALRDATISWYHGADHDLHAERPTELAADLLRLARAIPTPVVDE